MYEHQPTGAQLVKMKDELVQEIQHILERFQSGDLPANLAMHKYKEILDVIKGKKEARTPERWDV